MTEGKADFHPDSRNAALEDAALLVESVLNGTHPLWKGSRPGDHRNGYADIPLDEDDVFSRIPAAIRAMKQA